MKTFIKLAIFTALFLGAVVSQRCKQPGTIKLRADNFVSATLIHKGVPGATQVLSQAPDSQQWSQTYSVTYPSLDNGDVIQITATNIGDIGGMKASLNFDGFVTSSKAGNTAFTVDCAKSVNITGCTSNGFTTANTWAAQNPAYYGPGSDSLPADAEFIWTASNGLNPAFGIVVFDLTISCTPVCAYEYWEFLAIGYPWYHRAALDAWCGPYPAVKGQTTNCYNGAKQIAPACIESFPDFAHIVAGDSSVDWNKRCFLHC